MSPKSSASLREKWDQKPSAVDVADITPVIIDIELFAKTLSKGLLYSFSCLKIVIQQHIT